MNVRIYSVGGTIDKVYFDEMSRYEVGDPAAGEILREANVAIDFCVVSLLKKDSLQMVDEDRDRIAEQVRNESADRILITHGTDTMVETARRLQIFKSKTIVLTGAMQPARFKSSDAPFNIGYALAAVQILPPGVYIAMNGRLFDPENTRKNRELNRFETV